jgi:hypothetical protein
MMNSLGQQELGQKVVMNATQFSISGISLQNRGVYPITLAIEGEFALNGTSLGSSSIGPLSIPPGSQRTIDFNLAFNISSVLSSPSLMKSFLFNGTLMSLQFNVTGGMQPFLQIGFPLRLNETMGAALDGFYLTSGPYNATSDEFPVIVNFTNKSPLPLNATLSAQVLSTPLKPNIGNYGSGSMMISAFSGQNYQGPLNIYIDKDAVGQGNYLIELSLTVQGFTYSWNVTLNGGT